MLKPWALALAVAFTCLGHSAAACRLALVLAMDVSNSVDAAEDALQRGGLATALTSPDVINAFLANNDPVALAVFEWSGRHHQQIIQDWILIEDADTLTRVAGTIATSPRLHSEFPTAIGYALGFSADLLARAPTCAAQTIDISGDGVNNDGFEPYQAYGAFDLDDVTVNALVIKVAENPTQRAGQIELTQYFEQQVIQGRAAFVEVADGFEDFARAMEIKLIRELGVMILGQSQFR